MESKFELNEKELENVTGGQNFTKLPELADGEQLYVRIVESGKEGQICSPWVLYKGPETISELCAHVTGAYQLQYFIYRT